VRSTATKKAHSVRVGQLIAERAKAAGIDAVCSTAVATPTRTHRGAGRRGARSGLKFLMTDTEGLHDGEQAAGAAGADVRNRGSRGDRRRPGPRDDRGRRPRGRDSGEKRTISSAASRSTAFPSGQGGGGSASPLVIVGDGKAWSCRLRQGKKCGRDRQGVEEAARASSRSRCSVAPSSIRSG